MRPPPPSLLELLPWMARLLVRPLRDVDALHLPVYDAKTNRDIASKITPGPHLTAQQRMGIYNQQYWFRLLNVLQEDYPTLVRLFGYRAFNQQIAEPYLLKCVPDDWRLSSLGSRLPEWVEAFYLSRKIDSSFRFASLVTNSGKIDRVKGRTLILEAARIDEAASRLLSAVKLPPLSLEDMEGIEEKTLHLQPSAALFCLSADLFDFRKKLLCQEPDYWIDAPFPSIATSSKRYFVFFVLDAVLRWEEITVEEHRLLQAFERGATLEAALAAVGEVLDPSCIGGWFRKFAQNRWLTISHPDF